MNGTNGNGSGSHASIAGARPVVLVRYRPGVAGKSARTVHLVPLAALRTALIDQP